MELTTFDPRNFFLAFLVFIGACTSFEPPQPVQVETPGSVSSDILKNSEVFLIELKKDNTVWCIADSTQQSSHKVGEPVRQNLGRLIADYKRKHSGKKTMFLVKSHPKGQYAIFEKVIGALKDNDEFKYNLVTDK